MVYHLTHDISESDFDIEHTDEGGKISGQVEIIGWMYQYYNTEPKDQVFANLKKNIKISKENIPAATQLFTPDWIVRYMVENSLGRLWMEGHPNDTLKSGWKYYLEEAEQEPDGQTKLVKIREDYAKLTPEDIKIIDPCMGSGHILVYAFDVLMQIYEAQGYTQRDAARLILEKNIYGLDIDKRAYQIAYFAVMMKARQYNRRILNGETRPNLYAINDSSALTHEVMDYIANGDKKIYVDLQSIANNLTDAKEYGSIINVAPVDFDAIYKRIEELSNSFSGDLFAATNQKITVETVLPLIRQAQVMAQKYETVCTNPPYMGSSGMGAKLSDFVKKNYPDSKSDLFAVFIERCEQMTKKNGYQAMITQHAWMFLSSFEKLRNKLLSVAIVNMAHLGARAFEEIGGEVVQTTSFVIRKSRIVNYKGEYCRLIEPTSQQGKEDMFLTGENRYVADQSDFSKIPGASVAYWLSKNMFCCFEQKKAKDYGTAQKGLDTCDVNRFVRFWHEVAVKTINFTALNSDESPRPLKWFPYAKGGEYRKWFGNIDTVVLWENDGWELRNLKTSDGKLKSRPQNITDYFKELITWSAISSGKPSMRYIISCIYGGGGTGFVSQKDSLYYSLGFFNSNVAVAFLRAISPTLNYEAGHIMSVPYIKDSDKEKNIDELVKQCISDERSDWDAFETSWDFKQHPMLAQGRIADAYIAWKADCESRFLQLKTNEEELNRIFINIYGLREELTPDVADKDVTVHRIYDTKDDVPESMKGSNYVRTMRDEIVSLISYAVGCMFGRYSLDLDGLAYAGGEWDGIKYPTLQPDDDNCIPVTDEEYFQDDIVGRFVEFVRTVYGSDTLEENLDFIAKALGNKGNTSREVIRNYFLTDFIKDHIKAYQKRPIYWMFDSGKQNGFKALVYMHRWNADTTGNIRVEYLHRIQRVYESEINRMQDTIDNSSVTREISAAQKRKDKLSKQLKESKDYDAKIAHIALSRIDIDLDDGVKVNYEKVQTSPDGKKMEVLTKM